MYIASHIPITIFFDCQSLYPTSWIPQPLLDLTAWYIQNSGPIDLKRQQFALVQKLHILGKKFTKSFDFADKPITRVGLLAYGAHVATTVIATLAEVGFGSPARLTMTARERYALIGLYLPYFLIPATMVIDSWFKLSPLVNSASSKKKTN
ncbi:unnamed protein product [Umbelopsis ramanniana]